MCRHGERGLDADRTELYYAGREKGPLPTVNADGIITDGTCPACKTGPGYAHKMSCGYGAGKGITFGLYGALPEPRERADEHGLVRAEAVYMPDRAPHRPLVSATYAGTTLKPLHEIELLPAQRTAMEVSGFVAKPTEPSANVDALAGLHGATLQPLMQGHRPEVDLTSREGIPSGATVHAVYDRGEQIYSAEEDLPGGPPAGASPGPDASTPAGEPASARREAVGNGWVFSADEDTPPFPPGTEMAFLGKVPEGWTEKERVIVGVDPAAPDSERAVTIANLTGAEVTYQVVPMPPPVEPDDSEVGIAYRVLRMDGGRIEEIELFSVSIGGADFDVRPGHIRWGNEGVLISRRKES